MKKFATVTILLFMVLFQTCSGRKSPTEKEIFGTWQSSDGATIEFQKDGIFEGNFLAGEKIFFKNDEFTNRRFKGSGIWKIKEGKDRWKILLNFKVISNRKNGYNTQILLSRDGELETGDIWYLFEWEDEEEGGNRYKFVKTK